MSTPYTDDEPTSRGIVLVELAIIVPLVLVIIFAGTEFSRVLKAKQLVTTFSREMANVAFRECVVDPQGMGCQDRGRTDLQTLISNKTPGSEIIVSIYSWDDKGTASSADDEIRPRLISPAAPGTFSTKFDRSSDHQSIVDSHNNIIVTSSMMQNQGSIVIGEAYVPHRSIIRSFMNLFRFNREVLYDATIL